MNNVFSVQQIGGTGIEVANRCGDIIIRQDQLYRLLNLNLNSDPPKRASGN